MKFLGFVEATEEEEPDEIEEKTKLMDEKEAQKYKEEQEVSKELRTAFDIHSNVSFCYIIIHVTLSDMCLDRHYFLFTLSQNRFRIYTNISLLNKNTYKYSTYIFEIHSFCQLEDPKIISIALKSI